MYTAIGMIETVGFVAALEAADASMKAAHITLLGMDYARGGLVMVRFEGEVAHVQAAVEAGAYAASQIGHVLSTRVIARTMPEVISMLENAPVHAPDVDFEANHPFSLHKEHARRSSKASQIPLVTLSSWRVVDLRKHVRKLKNFPLSPNEIRYANKQLLLETIAHWRIDAEES